MKNKIYLSERVANSVHEFGESAEPRYVAMIVWENGDRTPALFTMSQIEAARQRAKREAEDVQLYADECERSANVTTLLIAGGIGAIGLMGAALWVAVV